MKHESDDSDNEVITHYSDEETRKFDAEIADLKAQLAAHEALSEKLSQNSSDSEDESSDDDINEETIGKLKLKIIKLKSQLEISEEIQREALRELQTTRALYGRELTEKTVEEVNRNLESNNFQTVFLIMLITIMGLGAQLEEANAKLDIQNKAEKQQQGESLRSEKSPAVFKESNQDTMPGRPSAKNNSEIKEDEQETMSMGKTSG